MPPPSEEWYSKSPQHKSLSPAAVKKFNEENEALSSHSSNRKCNDWNPIGKTPDEITAWCAEYERGQRSEMTKRCRQDIQGKVPVFAHTAPCNDWCISGSHPSYGSSADSGCTSSSEEEGQLPVRNEKGE